MTNKNLIKQRLWLFNLRLLLLNLVQHLHQLKYILHYNVNNSNLEILKMLLAQAVLHYIQTRLYISIIH